MYDIIIAGAGPAGMSAAVYASRAGLKTLVLEKQFAGGQIVSTHNMENYLGFEHGISGAEFSEAAERQATRFGAEILREDILEFRLQEKTIVTGSGEYTAKALILAMGASPRKLGLEKEDKFTGMGISYCATCDGAFFKNREVAVVGGGDTALEDALYLATIVKKVYIIHRRNEFRAQKLLVDRARQAGNIEFILSAVPERINGKFDFEGLTLKNKETGELFDLAVDGCFVAIGHEPQTERIKGQIELDASGYIVAGEDTKTSVEGVFAAGDIRTKRVRQVVTAAADGAVAAVYAGDFVTL